MFLARKITRAKWTPKAELSDGEIPADAVTADLRTRENSLSFWQCGTAQNEEVADVVLALAAEGNHIETIDIVWLSDKELLEDGQTLQSTDGKTPVTELVKRHVDICCLDYTRLGKVAGRVRDAIANKQCVRLTEKRVTRLLASAVEQGRVDIKDIKESIVEKIRKSLSMKQ